MVNKIKEIIESIPKTMVSLSIGESEKEWTHEIKKQFLNLGKQKNNNYHICTSKSATIKSDSSEWLYDLCWIEYDRKNKSEYNFLYLKKIILALESELGNSDKVIDDFHKLLQSKAEYKVMIFQAVNSKKLFNYMKKNIRLYWNSENKEKYILACYNKNKNEFDIMIIQ